ncbi:MAG TPA: insecticidal delta-endotoxin Cry8Ea1 family protein [Dyella sp.]|uniref:insecticidal delta-endotoxin Cry8Ea1 family protein n=1 Tax=Dyella sp. TaxID=1869338 RepID=UPI002F93F1E0
MIRKPTRGEVACVPQPFQPGRRRFMQRSALGAACIASAPLLASSGLASFDPASSSLVDAFGRPLADTSQSRADPIEWTAKALRELLLLYLKLPFVPSGGILSHLAALFIPIPGTSVEELWVKIIDARISEALFNKVKQDLIGLTDVSTLYRNAVNANDPQEIRETCIAVNVFFTGIVPGFQISGEEVPLLPLFAMGATLHLSLLHDIVLKGKELGFNDTSIANYQEELRRRIDGYTQYVDTHVAAAIEKARIDNPNIGTPLTRNMPLSAMLATKANLQVDVLDLRDTWYAFDAAKFPNGATIKLDREILSPICGWWDLESTSPSKIPDWSAPNSRLKDIRIWNNEQWRTSFLMGFSLDYENDPTLETGKKIGQMLSKDVHNKYVSHVQGFYSAGVSTMVLHVQPDGTQHHFGSTDGDLDSLYSSSYADHCLSSIRSVGEGRSTGAAVNAVSGCIFGFQLIDQEAKPLSEAIRARIAQVSAPRLPNRLIR